MIKKNEIYEVEIIDTGFNGEGIAKIDNFTVFIPNAIKGEKIKIIIVKVLQKYAFGKILEILEASENRVDADCVTYQRCGGCSLRHIKYLETLKMKQNMVQSLVNKTLKNKIVVEETLGMKNPYNYRNKAQYPCGIDKEQKPVIGVFANRTHEIVPIINCAIQHPKTEKIAKEIITFVLENNISIYDEKTGKGLLRHIVIKIGFKTDEIMCILVLNGYAFPKEKEFVEIIVGKYPEVKTIVKNINMKNTNVILGRENITIYGGGYIKDKLGKYFFNISPSSFYQVNPIQAEKLYNLAIESAFITKEDIVFDLYCGIGTISIFVSDYAKKVYGVEIVDEAVKDARENAKINNINNVEFFAGDVEIILDELINSKKIEPDVVIVDPPRRGLDNNSIQNLIKIKPRRIAYISCNPATLVRDLAVFEDIYDVKFIKPVDMFPFTSSVECCSVLQLKKW